MINIAICDDEPNIRTYISSLVKKQNAECEITEYASADEYLSVNKEHELLFLDVEAFHFLIKPIDKEKYIDVFQRATKRILAEQEQQKSGMWNTMLKWKIWK